MVKKSCPGKLENSLFTMNHHVRRIHFKKMSEIRNDDKKLYEELKLERKLPKGITFDGLQREAGMDKNGNYKNHGGKNALYEVDAILGVVPENEMNPEKVEAYLVRWKGDWSADSNTKLTLESTLEFVNRDNKKDVFLPSATWIVFKFWAKKGVEFESVWLDVLEKPEDCEGLARKSQKKKNGQKRIEIDALHWDSEENIIENVNDSICNLTLES